MTDKKALNQNKSVAKKSVIQKNADLPFKKASSKDILFNDTRDSSDYLSDDNDIVLISDFTKERNIPQDDNIIKAELLKDTTRIQSITATLSTQNNNYVSENSLEDNSTPNTINNGALSTQNDNLIDDNDFFTEVIGVDKDKEPKHHLPVDPNPATPKEKTKRTFLNILFISFNILAILIVLIMENNDGSLISFKMVASQLGQFWYFGLIAIAMYAIHVFCDTLCFSALIKESGYDNKFSLGSRVAILGKYYDCLTPWSTGGQPFQILYMVKNGIDTPSACSLPLVKYCIRIIFINITVLSLFLFYPLSINSTIRILAYIGLTVSMLGPSLLILFTANKKLGIKVTCFVVRLLHKLKIVKDYDKQIQKAFVSVDNFLSAVKYLSTHKRIILLIGLLNLVDFIAVNSLPFFVIKALGYVNINFVDTLVMCLYASMAAAFAPTPGAAGAAEASFYTIFAATVQGGYLFWAILLWRVLIFYTPLVLGVFVHIQDFFMGRRPVNKIKQSKWYTKEHNEKV